MTFRNFIKGVIFVALMAASEAAAKQDAAPPATQQNAAPMHSQRDRLKAAVDELNLTEDQKTKLAPLFAEAKTQGDAVRGDATLSPDQKKAKMKEIGADLQAKVHAVLTPEQRAQLKAKMQEEKPKPSM
jgi:Spy/CpxP family protein refolding chaperone